MKKPLLITYIVLGTVTVGTFVPLTIWAASDKNNYQDIEVYKADLILDDNVRLEYIEQEKFDPTGITFTYNNEVTELEDLKINYDFSISGTRVVEFVKEVENKHYRALLPVHVYHVRHLDIRDCTLNKNIEDDSWDYSSLTIWAELNEPAKSLPRPEGFNDSQTVTILNPDQYNINITPTPVNGVYQGNVVIGNVTSSFRYYDAYTYNPERLLVLTNQSNNNDKLTLFLETSTNDFSSIKYDEELKVTGKYLYEDSNGKKTLHEFSYVKPINGWDSVFNSNDVDGSVNDYYDDTTNGYKCEINGTVFYSGPEEWHKPILGTPKEDPVDPPSPPEPPVDPVDINAEIIVGANAQVEYFEGEDLNTTDLSFKYEDEIININNVDEIIYDFTTSGEKSVIFKKTIDEVECAASLDVKVLKIKSFDVRNNNVFDNHDGTYDYSNLEIWVDLDGQSSRLSKPDDFSEPEQTAFILTSEYYDFTVKDSVTAGVKECQIQVGSASFSFNLYNESAFDAQRILHLHNRNDNGDKLTLFVLSSSTNYVWGSMEIIVTGEYLYEKSDGNKYTYKFYYYKADNSWTSEFKSKDHNGNRLNDYYGCEEDGEGYTAVVNGVYFYSLSTEWHKPILNF